RRQPFDGGDLFAGGLGDQHAAGADRDAVDVNGAGAALCNAATIVGAGQANILPNYPQQRRIRFDVDIKSFAVDGEACHDAFSFWDVLGSAPYERLAIRGDVGPKHQSVQIKILRLREGERAVSV